MQIRPKSSFLSQLRAVFFKNISLQWSQKKVLIFQMLPVLIMLVIAIGIAINGLTIPKTIPYKVWIGDFPKFPTGMPIYFRNEKYYTNGRSFTTFWFNDKTGGKAGNLSEFGNNIGPTQNGLLGSFTQELFVNPNTRAPTVERWPNPPVSYPTRAPTNYPTGSPTVETLPSKVPFFTKKDNLTSQIDEIKRNYEKMEKIATSHRRSVYTMKFMCLNFNPGSEECREFVNLLKQTPWAGFEFNKIEETKTKLELSYEILGVNSFTHSENEFGGSYLLHGQNLIHSAALRHSLNYTGTPLDSTNLYGLNFDLRTTQLMSMGVTDLQNAITQVVHWILSFSLLIPFFMQKIVIERSSGLMEMSKMAGLSSIAYWLSLFLNDYLIIFIILLFNVIVGLCFQFLLLQINALFYLTLLVFGYSLLSVSYIIAVFFKNTSNAMMVGYLIALLQAIVGLVVNFCALPTGQLAHPAYYIWPPLGAMRAIFVLYHAALSPFFLENSLAVHTAHISNLYSMGYSTVFFIITLYLDQVLPKAEGMRKSVFFPIIDTYKAIKHLLVTPNVVHHMEEEDGIGNFALNNKVSEDLLKEIEIVKEVEISQNNPPLIIQGISKEFDNFKAVSNIWLHVGVGDCFGLLGPNGAGKTTLVNMIVGLSNPTHGTGKIGGFDIVEERSEVQRRLGLCPQFDIHYESLTVEEHLYYYSRLWGFHGSELETHVNQLLDEVGLYEEKNRLGKDLSGGQKRRLSVAIAISGNPAIVILDEPTSSLDPGVKHGVWEVITKAKKNRAFLLTTHSMQEADVLCTRIGIMNRGELLCIGNQKELKNKYGKGLKIDLIVEDIENEQSYLEHKAHLFIKKIVPEAELISCQYGCVSYQIPKTTLLSKVFVQLEFGQKENGIISHGISQASLQEVFFAITKMAGDAEVF